MSRTPRLVRFAVIVAALAAACSGDEPLDETQPVELTGEGLPVLDVTARSVELDDVHFDTFDGGSTSLADASAGLIADSIDRIPPIDDPTYEAASQATWLDDDDVVIGYSPVKGEAYAFPVRILNLHEIVNDELGGEPVLVSYCPLCQSGVVYSRELGEQTLSFGNTSALYENDLVMFDRETNSYWWQVAGQAIVGTLTGERLDALPSETTTWGRWKDAHPDTVVLSRDTGFGRDYDRDPFAGYPSRVDRGEVPFPVSEELLSDPRLLPGTLVVAVEVDREVHAYPTPDEGEVVAEDTIGETQVVVMLNPEGGSAWRRIGDELQPIPSRTTLWFALLGAFPDVQVVETD